MKPRHADEEEESRFLERDAIDYRVRGHSLYEIVNYQEDAVLEAMRELYAVDESLCHCSLCVEDVYALALNSLPPRYIQPTSLRAYETSARYVPREEVRAHVREAAARVKAGPKH